ncbi:MAG: DUF4340 domain-containing protein [Calditrichaeota bacterium]|nr:DUF4340 domain-containing protein [Calditrichota bacterium]
MMKEKQLYILGGVFCALLLLFFVTKPRMKTVNVDELQQSVVIGVSRDDVQCIEVYKQTAGGEIRMEFVKKDKQWYIPTRLNAKAREYSVNRIIDDLLEMTGRVRAADPKHFATFQVGDDQGVHVILKDAAQKPLANLIIGKRGDDYNTGFVRFADREKIYAVDKNILSSLAIYGELDTLSHFNENSFVDLTAVKLEKKDLELVALVSGGKEVVIRRVEKAATASSDSAASKKEYEWVLVRGGRQLKIDQKEVDRFLGDVTYVYAQEVVDRIGNTLADLGKQSRYQFDRPTLYMVFMKKDDPSRYNVVFGREFEKDKGYFMYVQYDNLVYKVAKTKFDALTKWIDELPKKVSKA